jgi:hypothetical protein
MYAFKWNPQRKKKRRRPRLRWHRDLNIGKNLPRRELLTTGLNCKLTPKDIAHWMASAPHKV